MKQYSCTKLWGNGPGQMAIYSGGLHPADITKASKEEVERSRPRSAFRLDSLASSNNLSKLFHWISNAFERFRTKNVSVTWRLLTKSLPSFWQSSYDAGLRLLILAWIWYWADGDSSVSIFWCWLLSFTLNIVQEFRLEQRCIFLLFGWPGQLSMRYFSTVVA